MWGGIFSHVNDHPQPADDSGQATAEPSPYTNGLNQASFLVLYLLLLYYLLFLVFLVVVLRRTAGGTLTLDLLL